MNDDENENNHAGNFIINNNKTTRRKSSEYKSKVLGSTTDDNIRLDTEVVVSLKYLTNFCNSLNLFLINYKIVDLRWVRNCLMSEISGTAVEAGNSPVVATATTSAAFQINNANVYVPVVTFSINNNIKYLKYLKQWSSFWKKYRSKITTKPKNSNL